MVPTLFVTLTVGYQQLADAAFWGSVAFRRVDSIWIPVLVLYVAQLGALVRGTRTSPQSRTRGLTVAGADDGVHDSSEATSSSS